MHHLQPSLDFCFLYDSSVNMYKNVGCVDKGSDHSCDTDVTRCIEVRIRCRSALTWRHTTRVSSCSLIAADAAELTDAECFAMRWSAVVALTSLKRKCTRRTMANYSSSDRA